MKGDNTMAQITINVRDTILGIKQEVQLPDDIPMTELLPILSIEMRRSVRVRYEERVRVRYEESPEDFRLTNKTQNFEYNPTDTLADRGTKEGDLCLLAYEFACPGRCEYHIQLASGEEGILIRFHDTITNEYGWADLPTNVPMKELLPRIYKELRQHDGDLYKGVFLQIRRLPDHLVKGEMEGIISNFHITRDLILAEAVDYQFVNDTQHFEYHSSDTLASRGTEQGNFCLLSYKIPKPSDNLPPSPTEGSPVAAQEMKIHISRGSVEAARPKDLPSQTRSKIVISRNRLRRNR
jgi:hypothetical protein